MSTATTDSHTACRTTSCRSRGGMKAVSRTGLMRQTFVCVGHQAGLTVLGPYPHKSP